MASLMARLLCRRKTGALFGVRRGAGRDYTRRVITSHFSCRGPFTRATSGAQGGRPPGPGRRRWRAAGAAIGAGVVAVAGIACAVMGGCLPPPGDECRRDGDCGPDLVCSNTGDCATAGSLVRVRISWTFNGVSPVPGDAETCAGADVMSVSFFDLDVRDSVVFQPVVCSLGQILFDRISARFDEVTLQAHAAGGEVLDLGTRQIEGAETEVTIDLRL